MGKLIVSLSPHAHGTDSVEKNMYGVIIALLPALLASFWFFGLGSVVVCLASVLACIFFEWAITKYIMKREPSLTDGSGYIRSADRFSIQPACSRPCKGSTSLDCRCIITSINATVARPRITPIWMAPRPSGSAIPAHQTSRADSLPTYWKPSGKVQWKMSQSAG